MEDKTLTFTCTTCPMGCTLTTVIKDGIITVTGNSCPRGKAYAESEATNPVRTLTTTVRSSADGIMIPVRTNKPVPKSMLFKCMEEINKLHPSLPVKVGDVILHDLLSTGADVVCTAAVSA